MVAEIQVAREVQMALQQESKIKHIKQKIPAITH
jgi:hypothetical protein